jgi:hypothetical protein
MQSFDGTDLYVRPFGHRVITLKLSVGDIDTHRLQIVALLRACEAGSRGEY